MSVSLRTVALVTLTSAGVLIAGCSSQQRVDEPRGEAGLREGRDVSSTTAGAASADSQARVVPRPSRRTETDAQEVEPDYQSETVQVDEPMVAAEKYDATFEAAQETLRRLGFLLERVDARAGVITTRPKTTGGLATIWHREQASVGAEFEDALHRQRRTVRIEFVRVDAAQPTTSETGQAAVPPHSTVATRLRVRVVLERMNRPLHRIDSDSITSSTYAIDPYLPSRGMTGDYPVAFAEDRDLAQWIVDEVRDEAELVVDVK